MAKPNPMGATFAERAAAARGVDDFEAPSLAAPSAVPNSTFATRAGIVQPEPEVDVNEPSSEAAETDDEKTVDAGETENKAVQDSDNKSGRGNRRRP